MAKGISFEEALRPPEPAKPTGGFSFEEVMRPAAPAASAPVARKQEAPPAPVETAAGVLPDEATDLRDVFGRDLLSRPGREATFLGELGRGAKGAVEYGFPIMGRQLALQGSASAMAERQNQTALMDQIDQGQFKTLNDLKNSPQYQALREGGGNVGTLNAYFANRGQPEVSAKLRGGVEREMTKLAGDTAGHIKTLNQYAQENKAKYGPRVEKFTDINWTDPAVVADFKDWLGYNMGSGAVQMAPIMLAAALTKQPGLLTVSGGMGVSEAVGNRLKFVQDQVKSLPPEQQGQAIAKYIAESGDTNLVTGLVSGSFDLLLGPAAKLAKGALPKELGRMATVKQAVKELPKDIRGEAVTGALQQATQIAAAKKLQEEGRAVTWQNIKDVIDSAAAEAAGAPAGTAVNVGMAALQAPSDPASQLARAIEEDAQQAGATPEALRMRSALESAQAPPQARSFTFEEVTAPAADAVPPAAPVVTPAPEVAPDAPVAAPVATGVEAIPGMPTGEELETLEEAPAAAVTPVTKPAPAALQQKVPSFESSLAPGFVRVYHSGSKGDGKGARWASTDRTYASNYRADLPLFYTDIPANDPRVNNPDYPDQGVAQGFTFNFELSPQEAVQLKEVPRTAKAAAPAPAPAPAPAAPAKPRTTMQDVIQEMTDAELQDARTNVMFSLPAVDAEIAKRQEQQAKTQEVQKLILQNRDRGGQASREQMESIARAPDYDRAGFSNTPDGAPIVAFGNIPANQLGRTGKVTTAGGKKIPIQYAVVEADEILTSNDINGSPDKRYGDPSIPGLRAIAGNGRVTGIRDGFRRGTADAYRQAMTADDLHQVNPDVIAGMRNPVLVRLMPQESLSPTIGDELNQGSMLELSAVEQAKTDLSRVDFDTLSFGADGEVTPQSVNQFINSMPAAERGKLVDKGTPTRQAYQRLENAIFARAYQDDALISLFAQSQDPEARLLVSALMQVAPAMSRLEGAGNLDIREIVTDAAKMIISGKRRGLKLSEIAAQADMTTNPDSLLVVQLFAANPRSNKAAVEALNNLANIAYQEYVKPEEGLFGAQPKIGRAELLTKIGGKYEPTTVAGAKGAGAAPSDVQGKAKPGAAGVSGADQGFALVGETEAEIKAKRAAAEEREKREREERVAAEKKAKADEERGEFVLTGSDRAADETAARGQTDIFGAAPSEAAPTDAENPIEFLEANGFERIANGSEEQYQDKGGNKYLTLKRGPVRIALAPNEALFVNDRGAVIRASDQDNYTIAALLVEPQARGQGEAKKALELVAQAADKFDVTLFVQPTPLSDKPMSQEQLVKFYSSFGFLSAPNANERVLMREPGAAARKPTKGVGAAVMGERMVNAADRFRKAAMNQFKLTQEQADAAMGKLLKEKILILDPVTGQFELKDGRFWNREVMMRAAEAQKDITLESIEPAAAGKSGRAGWTEKRVDGLISTYGYADGKTFGIAAFVDPQFFLEATTASVTGIRQIRTEAGELDLQKLASETQTPYLKINIGADGAWEIVGHEGRHRAAALQKEGIGQMPVVLNILKGGFKYPAKFEVAASQELLGQTFGKARGEDIEVFNLIPINQQNKELLNREFGSGQILYSIEPTKKLPPGRSPELAAAAKQLQEGQMTSSEFDELVNRYRPIPVYFSPLKPATSEQVYNALDSSKRNKVDPEIPEGYPVGLRLDIPAFNRHGVFVVTIHEKRTTSSPGKAIGYSSVASIKNVTFGVGNQKEALKIAAGAGKDAIQTMEGNYVPITPEQAYEKADDAILSGDWVQVGFDPARHAYFFDRSTTMPVVAADEVIQIGNMILAKGVTYGKKEDFLYSIDATGTPVPVAQAEAVEKTRKEQIREYAKLRAEIAKVPDKIIKGEASLDMQANLSRMMQEARDLQYSIRMSKPRRDTAEEFLARALKEYADGNISRDVLDAIQAAYAKEPELLEGLMLSVRKKAADDGAAAGTFSTFQRLITLFKGTSGVQNPEVVRHELTHSLEQMMLPEQRMAVVQAWGQALQRAIKQNPDELHQDYFNAILNFLQDPTEKNLRLAQAAMPSIEMYQYINPSEFWAVNAEKLMAAQLGGSWEKFKRAVRKLWEGLKKVFGFDNRYEIHKVFNQVMGGSKERMTYGSLVSMINNTGGNFVTLNSIEEEKDLLEKYSRPKTPQLDTTPILTFLTRQFKNGKQFFSDAAKNPRESMVGAGSSVVDGLIYLRNKNVWYGSGLEARDFDRYNGDLKTSEGMATASAALDNAIRSGNIGVEVIFRGGIKFDPKSNSFVAVETERGMRGVYEAESVLKKRLGNQLGTDIIQGYLEAKRSISIMNELYEREAVFEATKEQLRYLRESGADPDDIALAKEDLERATKELEAIKKAASSVNMSPEEMDEFAALDAKHTELRDIMDNWTAINQNLLRFWRQVGLLSQGRYETLSAIKDYVPWYRIMNDEEDVHSPIQSTTRSMTNIGREKLFKRGKPISVVDVRAKAGQKDFKIQPSSVVAVEVNGKKVNPDLVTATPEGKVRIDMDLKANDLVVFKTNREIENIIDNMTRNVMRMTMNGIRQYAANRIVLEYASRNEKNKIMVFPSVDKEKGRFNWMVNGKKVVVEIQDPLVAASIYGMENLNLQMWKPMAMIANLTRRSITLSGVFQLKQVFKDAPTAALVTGVKNPMALIGGVWKGFVTSLTNTDPVVDILKAAGIGGYMSPARTPEADIKRRLGIMNRNVFSMMIKGLDHIGDASDMAQRVATYKRVLAETGNEAQALYQAANVINFLHHGSAGYAQAAVKVVPFLGAYANATDVLMRALVGGGLKGMSRKKALLRLSITTSMLVSLTLLYSMLAGGDPDYDELDDQTKLKNIIIPGTKIMLPMNTSAAYFFKAIPELIYNVVTREGTENEMDRRRIRNALADAARDMLLGPEPIPAGFKPLFEVAINHDFFTGRPVIPEGLKDVEAAEQYVASTSELGKKLSAMLAIPGTDGKRVLSPIEADHIVRGVFGTSGAMAQWVSNSIGAMAETRPEPTAKEAPITGSFLREEVPRGREDLFYDFKEGVTKKHQTWQKMMDREDYDAADKYLEKHGDVVSMYEYVNEAEAELKEINAEIRRLGETRSKDETPKERRKDIEDFKRLKQEILDPVKELRRETFTK